ncbi:hypothetical protein [Marinimicrobium sp. ABcell2]|uniref:hypothetical protein n=1 Tax=Marinimicrobium sp. ABcell2 TaxID=3069751 RepID=UPI0027B37D5B|nr:hypothetical protein [Marinimicrobium sp. ABcell2]MDQ2077134.1 hypothetical protein [Marinimicrobium sp. ABcell2]
MVEKSKNWLRPLWALIIVLFVLGLVACGGSDSGGGNSGGDPSGNEYNNGNGNGIDDGTDNGTGDENDNGTDNGTDDENDNGTDNGTDDENDNGTDDGNGDENGDDDGNGSGNGYGLPALPEEGDLSFRFVEGIDGWHINATGNTTTLETDYLRIAHDGEHEALILNPKDWDTDNWRLQARYEFDVGLNFVDARATLVLDIPQSYLDDNNLGIQLILLGNSGDSYGGFITLEDSDTETQRIELDLTERGEDLSSIGTVAIQLAQPPANTDISDPIAVRSLDFYEVGGLSEPGEPTRANKVVPIWQWGTVNHESHDSPAIRLTDRFDDPAAGYQVLFTALSSPSAGHDIEHTLVETDSDGIADSGAWTIPDDPGLYRVRAEPANAESGDWDAIEFSMGIYNPAEFEKVWGATTGHSTCAIDASGTAYCWSSGSQPAVVAGGMPFVELAVGSTTLFGLTAEGDTYSIGNPTNNPPPSSATLVASAPKFEQIVSGQSHRCGLTSDGTAYCWGGNRDGQSGAPSDTSSVSAPRAVDGDPPPFVHLDAGWLHTCALTAGGEAYCWGRNGWGQIGDNTTENRYEATPLETDLRFESLSLGNRYSCAMDAEGKIYCWGREFITEDPWEGPRLTPRQQAIGHEFVEISAGGYHTCGRHADGSVVCWGLNHEGSWGEGTDGGIRVAPGPVYGNHTFSQLTSSWAHSCGITENGLLCWGRNDLLGFPWHDNVLYPLFVSMPD